MNGALNHQLDATYRVDWDPEVCALYGKESFLLKHNIHESSLFSDEAVIDLIDSYPLEFLQAFTMGVDHLDSSKWHPVDTRGIDTRRISGKEIMKAVAAGRLWIKLERLHLIDARYQELVETLFRQIDRQCPAVNILWVRPLLLISSPGSLVYYHADAYPTMLFQIRGRKRMWFYPAQDQRFITKELMESIYIGDVDEEAPYDLTFEKHVTEFEVEPGDAVYWPINAPHRVTMCDSVNVTVSVQYGTPEGQRLREIYVANVNLRRRFGLRNPSTTDTGLGAFVKRLVFKAARRVGLTEATGMHRVPYKTSLRIDGSSPVGVSPIPDGPVHTPF